MSKTWQMIKAVRKAKKLMKKLCPKCQVALVRSKDLMEIKQHSEEEGVLATSNDTIYNILCDDCRVIYSEAKKQ